MGFAEVEGCWAHEVADVFDEQQTSFAFGELVHGGGDHPGIEMADGSGGDLNDWRAAWSQGFGVRGSFQIAYHYRAWDFRMQVFQGRAKERGFAGSG